MPRKSSPASADPGSADSRAAERRRTLYGRRQGRPLKRGRQTALDEWLPRLSIALPPQPPLDPIGLFDTPVTDVWLEVGFGSGEHLLAQAEANPQVGIIGCEPFINGMAALLARINEQPARAANIRVVMDDARPLLAALADASLGRVFVLFPDPWPKTRHHKRRFIAPATLDQLARVMKPGAELRLASDDAAYVEWALEHLRAHPAFAARADADGRRRPPDWPETRYEAKARAAGRQPSYLAFRRRAA